jgi:hypothetical protein
MKTLKFNKEPDNRWYVDLPEWEGPKADLEMVSGADTMLDIIAQGEGTATLYMDTTYHDGFETLELNRPAIELGNGAYYTMGKYQGIDFDLEMWLCDVTKFVFDEFPTKIYFAKI